MTPPPLDLFLSEEWIAGAFQSRLPQVMASRPVVAPSSGALLQLGELAAFSGDLIPDAIEPLREFGSNAVEVLTSGSAFSIAGWAAQMIQLVYGALERALFEGADSARKNAMKAQFEIASYLAVRRVSVARLLPGGANFSYTQPGWKKDWPHAAFPPVPRRYISDDGGKTISWWNRIVLFGSWATPWNVDFDVGCFSLGSGGCEAPPDSVIGVNLWTWPILVEDYGVPWGGLQLTPLVSAITSPTVLHVRVPELVVDHTEVQMRRVMRDYWSVAEGPPIRPNRVTIWPDGTYVAPSDPTGYTDVADYAGPFYGGDPRYPERGMRGETAEWDHISPTWYDLERVSAAFRQIARWRACRRSCYRNFNRLAAEVKSEALKNPDFNEENVRRWGGPNAGAIPAPRKPKSVKDTLGWKP